jgi:hypothetical protein
MLYLCFIFILRIFKIIPHFGFNSSSGNPLMLVFLTFQELPDSKKGKVREHSLKILRQTKWAKVGHQEINGLQTEPGGTAGPVDRATRALLCLERPMQSIFACSLRLDLKPTIKRVPWAFPWHGGMEIENKETLRQKAIVEGVWRGETLPESPPMDSTPLSRVHHHHLQQPSWSPYFNLLANMMRGIIYCFLMIYCIYV